jgi:1-pyrroline-5-carboxylate dehydrogenase
LNRFKNEPFTDFSKPANRRLAEQAILKVESELGKEYPIVIGGRKVEAREKFRSICPADPQRIVGVFQRADAAIARDAVEAAAAAFEEWRFEKPATRAAVLFKAAKILRSRRFELAAWMAFEVGKTRPQADGEISQAIDFCEFYGREAIRCGGEQPLVRIRSERNELVYIPLGVGIVVAPWNFPVSIFTGMTAASLVCGNTVAVKPSSDSPTVGAKCFEILEEAGVPAGVVNFVTGSGGIAGEAMIEHPRTRFVAFTGSKQVGLRINEVAAKTAPGQIWIKRATLEMGGKNAIVVAEDADLESAVSGVAAGAYGFQGQKCTACSRAIVVRDVYERFLSLLVPKVEAITVGPPTSPDSYMGPVINDSAMKNILNYIEVGKREGRLLTGGTRLPYDGFYLSPTVIADVAPDAVIAQEEIFGPVLSVIPARDYRHALEIANGTQYGLSGSVYTRDSKKIELARRLFHVGNLFFNRSCAGVMVGVHPLGGFNMSGTDSKTGSRDYLLLFLQAKAMAEMTSQRRQR